MPSVKKTETISANSDEGTHARAGANSSLDRTPSTALVVRTEGRGTVSGPSAWVDRVPVGLPGPLDWGLGGAGLSGPGLALDPLRSPGWTPFGVNATSLGNDLQRQSSDAARTIAERRPLLPAPAPGSGAVAGAPDPDLSEVDYAPNPTRMPLGQALSSWGHVDGPRLDPRLALPGPKTEVMWVLRKDGELVFGTRPHDTHRPHPTLVGEADPEVLNGGTLTMQHGLIQEVRDDSGHFRPSNTEAMLNAFSQLPPSAWHPDFNGFKPFQGDPIRPEFTAATPSAKRYVGAQAAASDSQGLAGEIGERLKRDKAFEDLTSSQREKGLPKAIERQGELLQRASSMLDRLDALVDGGMLANSEDREQERAAITGVREEIGHFGVASARGEPADLVEHLHEQNRSVLSRVQSFLNSVPGVVRGVYPPEADRRPRS